jgi:HAD superfamily hydrolase (TIGR01509 family)
MGAGTALRELFWTRRLIIVDFDGPITRLLPDPRHIELADRVKRLLASSGAVLPPDVTRCIDHVQVLRYAAETVPDAVPAAVALCSEAELGAADAAIPAAGAVEVLDRLRRQSCAVAIVTNNDPRVVERFAQRQHLDLTGITVHGRDPERLNRLKPAPWMLLAALRECGCEPSSALFLGDTSTDVAAAAAAGMPCLGVASEPAQAEALTSAGAVGVVPDLSAIG